MDQEEPEVFLRSWPAFTYFQVYKTRFDEEECNNIINLHRENAMVASKFYDNKGTTLRDSDIFWIPSYQNTDWIFNRLWNLVQIYNSNYGFDLVRDTGQAQLTRYRPGQHYEWHMDLGSGQPSLRKITAVVELTARHSMKGGGIEIFHGQSGVNKVDLDIGDVVIFPSFIMHRASVVDNGTRWSLVLWLNGARPFR
jgi:PKHD-type hydroxylase